MTPADVITLLVQALGIGTMIGTLYVLASYLR